MATGGNVKPEPGDKEIQEQENKLSKMEINLLEEMFKTMGAKPKLEKPKEMRRFLLEYLKSTMDPENEEEKFLDASAYTEDEEHVTTTAPAGTAFTFPAVTTSWMAGTPGVTTAIDTPVISASPTPAPAFPSALPIPRIDTFSGDSSNKNEVTYEFWNFQVNGLLQSGYPMSSIRNCVLRSLKGTAAKIAMRLGHEASVQDILAKFKSVYGPVDAREGILAEFYSARQRQGEDVCSWGCRLEDIINKAIDRKMMTRIEADEKLRAMFWEGMQQDLKDTCGYLNASIKDFDQFRVAVREIEDSHNKRRKENDTSKKPATSKMATVDADSTSKQLNNITTIVNKLSAEMNHFRRQFNTMHQPYNSDTHNAESGYQDIGMQPKYSQGNTGKYNYGRRNNRPFPGRGFIPGRGSSLPTTHTPATGFQYDTSQDAVPYTDEPVCYRCGQVGHISIGCYVRLDHLKKNRGHLNMRRSTGRRGRR